MALAYIDKEYETYSSTVQELLAQEMQNAKPLEVVHSSMEPYEKLPRREKKEGGVEAAIQKAMYAHYANINCQLQLSNYASHKAAVVYATHLRDTFKKLVLENTARINQINSERFSSQNAFASRMQVLNQKYQDGINTCLSLSNHLSYASPEPPE